MLTEVWTPQLVVDGAARALRGAEEARTLEQSPYGLESLSELELHDIIAAGFAADGLGVLREVVYPGEWMGRKGRRKALPEQSERMRCDVVLTVRPGQKLIDRLDDRRAAEGTLFEGAEGASDGLLPEHAFWLELKESGQFCYTDGVPGPNRVYGSQVMRAVRSDLTKLRNDPAVIHAGAMLILFAADEAVARHDLGIIAERCTDRGLLATLPTIAGFAVPERIGNRWCAVALFPPVRNGD